MLRIKLKGQSTLEYVILLGFVVAALIAMSFYMKRGAQGRLRESTDQIGEQYAAGKTTGNYIVTRNQSQHESLKSGGHITTTINYDTQSRSGSETVDATE